MAPAIQPIPIKCETITTSCILSIQKYDYINIAVPDHDNPTSSPSRPLPQAGGVGWGLLRRGALGLGRAASGVAVDF